MKLNPSTLFFVLTALLLGGVVLVVQSQSPPAQEAQQAEPQNLFAFQESQVKALTLQTQLRSLKFERDKDGKWQMLEPDKVPASDASIAFLLDQVATGKSQRSFSVKGNEREDYSFHQPLATIEVTLNNQETHKLILGGYDFNRSNLYALADPPADPQADLKVLLVSPNFENAVSRPLADWKAAPSASPSPASPNPASPSPASPDAATPPSPAPSTVSPPASSSPESASPTASPSPAPTVPDGEASPAGAGQSQPSP